MKTGGQRLRIAAEIENDPRGGLKPGKCVVPLGQGNTIEVDVRCAGFELGDDIRAMFTLDAGDEAAHGFEEVLRASILSRRLKRTLPVGLKATSSKKTLPDVVRKTLMPPPVRSARSHTCVLAFAPTHPHCHPSGSLFDEKMVDPPARKAVVFSGPYI
jgi:hypothetical protein